MELRTLRAFVEVVRQGGFTEASKVVFATQSTVSKAVKQLEDELGLKVLDRIGHRSSITAAGEIVYCRALTMLAERENMLTELDDLRGLRRGVLRLGLPQVTSEILFPPIFAAYRARYPGVEVKVVEGGSTHLEELLRSGDIDLGGLVLSGSEDFEFKELRREPVVALLAKDHPLAETDAVPFRALASVPFILFEDGYAISQLVIDGCRENGFTPSVAVRSSQFGFMMELAAAGMGVTFIARVVAQQRAHPGVKAVLVTEPSMEWRMALSWRAGGYLSQAARAWLALAEELNLSAPGRPTYAEPQGGAPGDLANI
jgi:DNA-binding transcriptional LysR family regulator